IGLQLAVQGSQAKINSTIETQLKYMDIDSSQQFYVVNINDYDLILGTPWMYQH
ncbi:hypothetical protein BYT27DRAFT_7103341, partial [Phlegmacium glaucopus]